MNFCKCNDELTFENYNYKFRQVVCECCNKSPDLSKINIEYEEYRKSYRMRKLEEFKKKDIIQTDISRGRICNIIYQITAKIDYL